MFSFDPPTCVSITHTDKINNNKKNTLQNLCFEIPDNQDMVAWIHPCVDLSGSIQTHRTNKAIPHQGAHIQKLSHS